MDFVSREKGRREDENRAAECQQDSIERTHDYHENEDGLGAKAFTQETRFRARAWKESNDLKYSKLEAN